MFTGPVTGISRRDTTFGLLGKEKAPARAVLPIPTLFQAMIHMLRTEATIGSGTLSPFVWHVRWILGDGILKWVSQVIRELSRIMIPMMMAEGMH
ncbi:hypothetical protein D9M70_347160 [compost metagenome]